MHSGARQTAFGPVGEAERIASLDVLRGFAVLGILVINIQHFAMIDATLLNPTAYGNLTGANLWVWRMSHLLADQKFMTIFLLLFGAGVVLITQRAEARGVGAARTYYRRTLWLILFGLLHGYLLSSHDILFSYGVCGLLVYLLRKKSPRVLLMLGLLALAIPSGLYLCLGLTLPLWPPDAVRQVTDIWLPPAETIAADVAAYQGSWIAQVQYRALRVFKGQTVDIGMWLWRTSGLMLMGIALYRLGVFSATRSRAFYGGMVAVGGLVGLPLVAYGMHRNFAAGWDVRYAFFLGSQWNYWGSVLVSGMWVGLVILACRSKTWQPLTRPLVAVGRMAFTNYILQTVICTFIFYGHGLGLYGTVSRVQQIAIVFAVWVLQLVVSPLWLRSFQFGPLEWLWRSLTYRQFAPFRRRVAGVVPG
jgi:uncharacterized protein